MSDFFQEHQRLLPKEFAEAIREIIDDKNLLMQFVVVEEDVLCEEEVEESLPLFPYFKYLFKIQNYTYG